MTSSQPPPPQEVFPHGEEIPERLDEQHIYTTRTLGFLIHPSIPIPLTTNTTAPTTTTTTPTTTPPLKIADIGTGTGIWLLDISTHLPPTTHLTGYDITPSTFPPPSTLPPNITFKTHNMLHPFPPQELGTYDLVAVRFVSVATKREEWRKVVANLKTLLKPGKGWLQWVDSCNFNLYNSVPGTGRGACWELFEGLEPMRVGVSSTTSTSTSPIGVAVKEVDNDDIVLGMMMRGGSGARIKREEVWRDVGFVDVHEDVFSSDRLGDGDSGRKGEREKATRNTISCFAGCLEGWSSEAVEELKGRALREAVDGGVYCTFDQVCVIGRRVAEEE